MTREKSGIYYTMTRRAFILALFALLSFSQTLQAQTLPRGAVKGRVLDDSTRAPIPLANVFISNSTIGTATNADGVFELKGVPLGSQQVVASIVGYQPGVTAIQLNDTTARSVEIRLKSRPIQMAAVEVEAKDPAEWRKQLESFLKEFIGSSYNAAKCKVLNPEVLDFFEESPHLVATAREPLEIENKALGYHVRCVLIHFAFAKESMQFIVLTSYSNLTPRDRAEENEWNANRVAAFKGSQRHFLLSLLRKSTKAESFKINRVTTNMLRRSYSRSMGFTVDPDTLMKPGEFAHQHVFSFPDLLQVLYHANNPPQVSLIEMNRPRLVVYPNGHMEDPLGVWTYGFWSSRRFADMLPIDYEPK
jgi:hypothetical protein